jgi:hypothetical protein
MGWEGGELEGEKQGGWSEGGNKRVGGVGGQRRAIKLLYAAERPEQGD